MGFGGNPYGPAGTGKTESVKALGQAFGRQVRGSPTGTAVTRVRSWRCTTVCLMALSLPCCYWCRCCCCRVFVAMSEADESFVNCPTSFQVLVFNCDEGIDFQSMGRIFIGLVKVRCMGST